MRATRIPTGWRVQCDEVPGAISEVRRLGLAEEAQREAIAFVEDADESEIGALHLIIDLPGSLADDVADLRSLSDQATQLRQAESLKRAGLARALLAQDLPMRDVGAILGISHQRVAQIVAADSGTQRR